jgi:O-antigen biosynthesis protein WbqP
MLNKILALLILIFLSPVFVIVVILIMLDDGFPIFFKQKRVGKDHLFFKLYKFRSMKKNTPNVASHLLLNPKVYTTYIGEVLRKLNIDELPNLINIVKGDIVFVGPRPALYNQYNLIKLRSELGILNIKPGLTGWAQINGRDKISVQQKVDLDNIYLKRKSLIFDLYIIFKTILYLLSLKNK